MGLKVRLLELIIMLREKSIDTQLKDSKMKIATMEAYTCNQKEKQIKNRV